MDALIERKIEFTQHLLDIIKEQITKFFIDQYNKITGTNPLMEFQNYLLKIPDWSQLQVDTIYETIKSGSKCKYLEDLIKETIIVYIKIQILSYNIDKQIRLKRIFPESFIHRVILLCAKQFIKKPHLFYHNIKPIEKQYNMNKIEELVEQSITNGIRSFIPIEEIINVVKSSNTNVEIEESDKDIEETEESEETVESEESEDTEEIEDSEEDSEEDSDEDEEPIHTEISLEKANPIDIESIYNEISIKSDKRFINNNETNVVVTNEPLITPEIQEILETLDNIVAANEPEPEQKPEVQEVFVATNEPVIQEDQEIQNEEDQEIQNEEVQEVFVVTNEPETIVATNEIENDALTSTSDEENFIVIQPELEKEKENENEENKKNVKKILLIDNPVNISRKKIAKVNFAKNAFF